MAIKTTKVDSLSRSRSPGPANAGQKGRPFALRCLGVVVAMSWFACLFVVGELAFSTICSANYSSTVPAIVICGWVAMIGRFIWQWCLR